MEKKLKILYDATILADGEVDVGCRGGIYFVALNVLSELLKREDAEVVLYSSPSKGSGLNFVIETKFPLARSLYKDSLVAKAVFSILLFVRKRRMKYFHQPTIRKMFSLVDLIVSSIYDFCFGVKIFLSKKSCYDVYFSPLTAAPWFVRFQKHIEKYVVLHDVIPLKMDEYSSQRKNSWFGHLIKHLNSQDTYFAISNATKKDFCSACSRLKSDRVRVVYWAANSQFQPVKLKENIERVKRKYKLPLDKRYVFSLCTLEPRKNLIRAVKTFVDFAEKNKITDMIFVLGGGAWKAFSEKIKEGLNNPELFDRYVMTAGYVDDEDLPILYSNAEWFVYTSQYEGFGLPPLEAMQCGCPVITSNNSSLPEVVGDAGIMIDWDSDEQHIAAYEKYYFDENLRREYAKKGLERATLFSWEKATDEIVNVMKGTL